MKRLYVVLTCVAVILSVATGAVAGEQLSWGQVKCSGRQQPAAKVVCYPVTVNFYDADESRRTGYDANKNTNIVMLDAGVPFKAQGNLVGDAGLTDGHWLGNVVKDPVWWPGPEHWLMYFQGTIHLPGTPLDGLEGGFAGRCTGAFAAGPYEYETVRGVLHGSGGLEGLKLHFEYTNYQPFTGVEWDNELVGEIQVPPSFLK